MCAIIICFKDDSGGLTGQLHITQE